MFNNLFKIFEPFYIYFLRSITFNIVFILIFISYLETNKASRRNTILTLLGKKENISNKRKPLFVQLFKLTIILNLLGLTPWVLCNTSHIRLNWPLAVSFWTTIVIIQIKTRTKKILIHITPKGRPLGLRLFLVFIETISKVIQPLTLSLRLTANIIAGHIIISLLRRFIIKILRSSLWILLTLIIVLEICVALIQGYVYTFLLFLYTKS